MYLEGRLVLHVAVPHAQQEEGQQGEQHVVELDGPLGEEFLAGEGVAAVCVCWYV